MYQIRLENALDSEASQVLPPRVLFQRRYLPEWRLAPTNEHRLSLLFPSLALTQ